MPKINFFTPDFRGFFRLLRTSKRSYEKRQWFSIKSNTGTGSVEYAEVFKNNLNIKKAALYVSVKSNLVNKSNI